MINFSESGHPVYRGSSVLKEEMRRAKEKENCPYISMAVTKQSK